MTEQDFIDAINGDAAADPERNDRTQELIYADWLDEQGDPRGEAWRVLIEAGFSAIRSPPEIKSRPYQIWFEDSFAEMYGSRSGLKKLLNNNPIRFIDHEEKSQKTYHAAMDAAAIAWVRCHRDPVFC